MKPQYLSILATLLFFWGCSTVSTLSPEARKIDVEEVSSTRVSVGEPVLLYDQGIFAIRGTVNKAHHKLSTTSSYLEVVFFNAAGDQIGKKRVDFTPAKLPLRRLRHHRYGTYSLSLGSTLPLGVTRIEVQARDADKPKN